MGKKVYQEIASALIARSNCIAEETRTGEKHEWTEKHERRIEQLVNDYLPHGSGVDNGVSFDFDTSTAEKLVFHFGYHHMNKGGFYDGWTDHSAIVTPSLAFEIGLKITGRNRNDIKDYLVETFSYALAQEVKAK